MKLSDYMRQTGTTPHMYNISRDTWIFRNPFNQSISGDLTITADTIRGVHNEEFNLTMYKWDDVVRQHKRENA